MGKILELITSRKFLAALGTILGLVGTGMQELQPWSHVIAEIVAVIMAWITGQSRVDAAKKANGG